MASETIAIDISAMPDVAHLARDVAQTGTPRALMEHGKVLAVISAVRARRRARRPKPFSLEDPLWQVVGIAAEAGPEDVARNKDAYLAKAYASGDR